MDTSDFFVLHNPQVLDSQDTSSPPVFFLSNGSSDSTAGSSLPLHTVLSAVSFLLCPSHSPVSAILVSWFSVLTFKKKYNRWHTHTIAIQILPFSCCGISFLLINLSYEYLRFCMCILSCLNLIHCTKDTIRCHPMSTLFSYKFVAWITTKTPLLIAFYQQRYLIEIIHYFIICYA